jgi:hypothetical protein
MGAPLLSRFMRQGGDFDLDRTKPSAAIVCTYQYTEMFPQEHSASL